MHHFMAATLAESTSGGRTKKKLKNAIAIVATALGYDPIRGYSHNFVDLPAGNDIMTINAEYNKAVAMNARARNTR